MVQVILLVVGLLAGVFLVPQASQSAQGLIHEAVQAPGTAALTQAQAQKVAIENKYVAAQVALKSDILSDPEIRGLATTLMGADYRQQINEKNLAVDRAQAEYNVWATRNGIELQALQADTANRIDQAVWWTRVSVLFTIVGGVSAALLVPVFVIWLAYILLRFLDGMSQAAVRKAKGHIEMRELYSGPHWSFLRYLAILGHGFGILPGNIPPRLLVFANAKYGSVTTVAMTTTGGVVVQYDGVAGTEILKLETMAELSRLALSTQATIAKNMSDVARNDSRSRMMLSLGIMLAAPIAALGRRDRPETAVGIGSQSQFLLPPVTADNAVSETVRSLGELAQKLGLGMNRDE